MSLEEQLTNIVEEVLGVHGVGQGESFFAAGGDSLRAAHLLVVIHDKMGADISLENFQSRPTIAGLSDLVLARLVERSHEGAKMLRELVESDA